MVVHIPTAPRGCEQNPAYLHLGETYTGGKGTWNIYDLYTQFGRPPVDSLLREGYLIRQPNESVWLSFKVMGSLANRICRHVAEEPLTFIELMHRFPSDFCPSQRLKSMLAFSGNFGLVQTFVLPCTAISCVAAETPETEEQIDNIYSLSNQMEHAYTYKQIYHEAA